MLAPVGYRLRRTIPKRKKREKKKAKLPGRHNGHGKEERNKSYAGNSLT